jgi:hypothetical protein
LHATRALVVEALARRPPLTGAEANDDIARFPVSQGFLFFRNQLFGPRGSPPTRASAKL